mmetsp:Transcript_630/g.1071  ORF Transcript_630/g.1071 Transcript_630/m.1071 type:complete len:84 (+) Transcript_630:2464-2715(+)
MIIQNIPVQTPVQAKKGSAGTCSTVAHLNMIPAKTASGPDVCKKSIGCPPKIANAIPEIACDNNVSVTPIYSMWVSSSIVNSA